MRIVILNGNPGRGASALDGYLHDLTEKLEGSGHAVKALTLRDLNAEYCIGCWSCWVRTPGLCIHKDDSHLVCREVINSDLVLFASPVIMGYLSAELKKFIDKMIPLIHPYITVDRCEAHHRRRYARYDYPLSALLLEKMPDTDDENIEIVSAIHARTMLNLKTKNVLTLLTDQPVEEAADAINHL